MEKKKTYVEDIERTLYDIRNEDRSAYKTQQGLTEEIIRDISRQKHDPAWMLEFRLKSLDVYHSISLPTWGPDLSELNMDEIVTYVRRHPWPAWWRSMIPRWSTTASRRIS